MFRKIECKVELSHLPFENLRYRDRTVLILPRDNKGHYVLGAKKEFYPEGIVRLVGGGINKDEDSLEAATREVREEMGVNVPKDEFVPLLEIYVEGKFDKEVFTHTIFIYFLKLNEQEIKYGDDVSELLHFTESDYRQLVKNYFNLASDHYFEYPGGKFSWGDYGRVYGFVHEKALDEVLARKL